MASARTTMVIRFCLVVLCFCVNFIDANTEKTIFVAPPALPLSQSGPTLAELNLDSLSPSQSSLRTSLAVTFPHEISPLGNQSWYLLSGLEPGKRYEVRICWAATQPTQFSLAHHSLVEVFDTPALIQDLAAFSEARQSRAVTRATEQQEGLTDPSDAALLFLRIWAAADFYTLDKNLMREPPSVDVDIILDPYALNVFPESLLPTATHILILAAISWLLSKLFWKWLQSSIPRKQHTD